MIVRIPTIKREMIDGEFKTIRGELPVDIDTSFEAHLKWEEHFQSTLKCSLTEYTERVKHQISNGDQSKVGLVGMLKMLYCYVNSDQLPTFRDFARLFDFEVADEILGVIKKVLDQLGKTASKN
jgi:hypothetical protein